jgi:hypothetical protein
LSSIQDLIKPICLPIAEPLHSKVFDDYQPFVVGWGNTQESGKPATVLQQLQIKVFSNNECINRYRAINKLLSEKQFNDAVLCAGVLEGGMDSCQGDSGGPLMYPNVSILSVQLLMLVSIYSNNTFFQANKRSRLLLPNWNCVIWYWMCTS